MNEPRQVQVGRCPAGGKRSVYLAIDPDFGSFTGALLRGTELITTRVDFAGTPHDRHSHSFPDSSPETLYKIFEQVAHAHGVAAKAREGRYLGLGVAVSSVVDESGAVHPSAGFPHDFEELPVRLREAALSAGAKQPTVVIENDANCTAIYHHQRTSRAVSSILSLVFTRSPTSVGAGIIVSGALYRGRSGGAGEILPKEFGGDSNDVDQLLALTVRLMDPEAVVLAMDAGESALLPEENPRLRRELETREPAYVSNPEASVLGVDKEENNI